MRPGCSEHLATPVLALLDALPDAALVVSAERRVLAANQLYLDRFGPSREVESRHCYEVNHACAQPCLSDDERCPMSHVLKSGCPHRAVHLHPVRGAEVYVEVLVRPLASHLPGAGFLFMIRPLERVSAAPHPRHLVGQSPVFRTMLEDINRAARTTTPVLVSGERGTGKKLVACTVHALSRRTGPFVPVDCVQLGDPWSQYDLFGMIGADDVAIRGLVASADKGTLFLEDVAALPRTRQGETLRLVEAGYYRPSGASDVALADVRVICATDQPLEPLVQRGAFRSDLLEVLQTCVVKVPPLRQRLRDLPLLAESLLSRFSTGSRGYTLDPRTLAVLERYDFPGNVTEFAAILESAASAADGSRLIRPEHLPLRLRTPRTRS